MSSTTKAPAYAAARWKALGSYVSLVVADQERLAEAQAGCERILDEVDRACSRFRDDSDLMRANRGAGRWVRVAPMLIQAMTEAVRVAQATDGLVDPTLGSHLVALGYDRDLAQVQALDALPMRARPRACTGGPGTGRLPSGIPVVQDAWRRIGIDQDGALRVPEGVALDLGATGKAFAADLIAATVPAAAGTALIISLGGDVAVGDLGEERAGPDVAEGSPTMDGTDGDGPGRHPWRVSIAERPQDADRPDAEVVVLPEGGLATSSTLARRWRSGDASVHHLLEASTGLPVEATWRTVSVCAASCVDANAASTAAIVMAGPVGKALAWLAERDLAARLVATDGSVLRVAGWPDLVP